MRPLSLRRDPAPSRSAYKWQRLMLTPAFRLFLRAGLPFVLVAGAAWIYLADEARRDLLVSTAVDIRRQIEQRPEFMVTLMAIDGASEEVAEDLREILPIDFPVSSFDLDLEAVRARAEELDAVAAADVRIRSGGVLSVTIEERTPAVVWRSREGLELLGADGHRVAALNRREARPDLPLLVGRGADAAVGEALELLGVATLIEPRIRGLVRVGERRWDVVLDRGQRIMLPEADPIQAMQRVIALDEAQRLLARDLSVVDIRNPDRVTLRLKPDALESFRNGEILVQGAVPQ